MSNTVQKEEKGSQIKAGYAAIIGRPNSGKSTLLNNILKHKISITSPKPQTTRMPIYGIYEDERGQIIFIDTPGIFAKVEDPVSKKINKAVGEVFKERVDVIVYLVDHTRDRDIEENKIYGISRKTDKPKIMAYNKIDIKSPSFIPHYRFMEDDSDRVVEISGLYNYNLNLLLNAIFDLLPYGAKIVDRSALAIPALNLNSKSFIAEIIREKAYIFLRKEIPYSLTTAVDGISERDNNTTYIKARIITSSNRYKSMIIGEKGKMIKEIGMAVRKELETATGRKIFLELFVERNPHWTEELF